MIEFWTKIARDKKKCGNDKWPIYFKIGKLIVNLLYPLTQLHNTNIGIDPQGTAIVSLTSFPKRIHTVWVTIASLMNQTVKPKKIILWLSKEQFFNKKIPKSLEKLKKRGLEINFCDDIRPHKKYFYTMKEFPNDVVITADDDIFYPENHIETLLLESEKYPNCVVCRWSHEILLDKYGRFIPYNNWPNESKREPSFALLPVGCNGVLYPARALSGEVFNKDRLIELALYTDDLWLKCMELLNNTKAVNCDETPIIFFNNIFSQYNGLWKYNAKTGENRNDEVWCSLMREYPMAEAVLLVEENR